jgi:hypothetical protein
MDAGASKTSTTTPPAVMRSTRSAAGSAIFTLGQRSAQVRRAPTTSRHRSSAACDQAGHWAARASAAAATAQHHVGTVVAWTRAEGTKVVSA